jgi:protein required for attachment to host cells
VPRRVESRNLASYLDEAIAMGEFAALVLVAPPHFLGMLHGTLARQTTKHLQATVHKDLAVLDVAEIRQRLIDEVFPPTSPRN